MAAWNRLSKIVGVYLRVFIEAKNDDYFATLWEFVVGEVDFSEAAQHQIILHAWINWWVGRACLKSFLVQISEYIK